MKTTNLLIFYLVIVILAATAILVIDNSNNSDEKDGRTFDIDYGKEYMLQHKDQLTRFSLERSKAFYSIQRSIEEERTLKLKERRNWRRVVDDKLILGYNEELDGKI